MADIDYRPAKESDLPGISDLLRDADLPTAGAGEHLDGFLVAERDGAIVGCAALERYERAALLRSVVVSPSERGTGLGRALVGRMIAQAMKDGFEEIVLLTTTAARFFDRLGFTEITRAEAAAELHVSEEFRGACPDSATVMRLALENAASRRRATIAEGLARLPGPDGQRFAKVLEHGTLEVEIYAPRGHDPQSPHTRDELYVVVAGRGWFLNGPDRHEFGPGDVLFVPAGDVHRFEEFSDDLVVWVVFYGPEGGERGAVTSRLP